MYGLYIILITRYLIIDFSHMRQMETLKFYGLPFRHFTWWLIWENSLNWRVFKYLHFSNLKLEIKKMSRPIDSYVPELIGYNVNQNHFIDDL